MCDGGTCRACKLDGECGSGACGENGACLDEASIVYLAPAPTGVDAGTCTREAPCKELAFGAARTGDARQHIVFAVGTYALNDRISRQVTQASRLFLHGHGARLVEKAGTDGVFLRFQQVPVTMRDFEIFQATRASRSIVIEAAGGGHLIERVRFVDSAGLETAGTAVVRDVSMQTVPATATGLLFSGSLTADRVRIVGGNLGVVSNTSGAVIDATNLMVSNTVNLALDLAFVSGVVRFSTIADSGTDTGAGPRAVQCSGGVAIQSTIVWAPGVSPRAPMSTEAGAPCMVSSTIAGPTAVPGAANMDPLFVAPASRDYHLAPNSPARDMVDAGPATDIDGEARPKGARFDLGADEI
ncbi:MAG: hypothetical protein KF773_22255 [Deltaproteobacteria bacterium]|nr:hypothetical protein [Deltaproteobacteria bacterium]